MAKRKLVTYDDLAQAVDSVAELEAHAAILKLRWIGMVLYWHERSVRARLKYFGLRLTVVVLGAAIPVITTLSFLDGWQTGTSIAVAIVGAVVAGCAAWEGIANYGDVWREKRRAAELLKVEGFELLQLCGKYGRFRGEDGARDYDGAYVAFAAEAERLIAAEVGEYLGVFDAAVEEARAQAVGALTDMESRIKQATTRLPEPG